MRHATSAIVLLFAVAGSAVAQPQRTFVSAKNGLDTNPCTVAQPCRNLQRGVDAVASGGEVVPLDSGGYGPFQVGKPLTVATPRGIHAAVTTTAPAQGEAIYVYAGQVALRGLAVSNLGGIGGIRYDPSTISGGMLRVDSCSISDANFGINASRTLVIANCTLTKNNTGISAGTNLSTPSVHTFIEQSAILQSATAGVYAWGSSQMTIRDSVIAYGAGDGVVQNGSGYGTATILVERCTITGNVNGLRTSPDPSAGSIHVSRSVITMNSARGMWIFQPIDSRGDNTVFRNGSAETFSSTFAAK